MIKSYFTIAWRTLTKNKLYSAINIAGLSIGIAVCMLITLFVKDELSFDQFQKNKNDIYRLAVDEISPEGKKSTFGITGMMHGKSFFEEIPELKTMVRISGATVNIKHKNEVFVQNAFYTDSSFFDMFSADMVEGSASKSLMSPNSIVLSRNTAKKFFGVEKAVGKTLAIEKDGEFRNYTVTAVTENSPQNSTVQIEAIIPFDYLRNNDDLWINYYLNTFFIVAPGSNLTHIEKEMGAIFANKAKEELEIAKKEFNYNNTAEFKLQPFLDIHLSETYTAQNGLKESGKSTLSYILSGLAFFILVIACINFVNISTSHAMQRAKEIGVRKVMGGQRRQLMGQFMSESFLLNAGALILAILLTSLFLPEFNSLTSKSLSFSYLLDAPLVLVYAAIFLLTTVMAGFYPALILSSYRPVESLYGKLSQRGKGTLLKALVVFQFALSAFVIMLTIIQYKQVNLFTTKDLGYNDENIVQLSTGGSSAKQGILFSNLLAKHQRIVSVGARNDGSWITLVTTSDGQDLAPDMNVIDANFLSTLGLTVLEGRGFSDAFPADSTHSVLVNQSFVKATGWDNAIGKQVKILNRDPYTIVGVVQDYHFNGLYQQIAPQLFTCNSSYGGYGSFFIKISDSNIPQTLGLIKASFKEAFPTKPYSYNFLSDSNDKQYEKEMQMRQIIFYAAAMVLFISCMGLFGLSILTVEKKRKEIGVRKVLGANVVGIVKNISLQFLKLVLLGYIISAPIVWYVGNLMLQNYPFRVSIGPSIFIAALGMLLVVSFITVSYQAISAARANPIKSLRTE